MGYSPHKPPFGVSSCEVVLNHPDEFATLLLQSTVEVALSRMQWN